MLLTQQNLIPEVVSKKTFCSTIELHYRYQIIRRLESIPGKKMENIAAVSWELHKKSLRQQGKKGCKKEVKERRIKKGRAEEFARIASSRRKEKHKEMKKNKGKKKVCNGCICKRYPLCGWTSTLLIASLSSWAESWVVPH